jgi:hypothetical protein
MGRWKQSIGLFLHSLYLFRSSIKFLVSANSISLRVTGSYMSPVTSYMSQASCKQLFAEDRTVEIATVHSSWRHQSSRILFALMMVASTFLVSSWIQETQKISCGLFAVFFGLSPGWVSPIWWLFLAYIWAEVGEGYKLIQTVWGASFAHCVATFQHVPPLRRSLFWKKPSCPVQCVDENCLAQFRVTGVAQQSFHVSMCGSSNLNSSIFLWNLICQFHKTASLGMTCFSYICQTET